MSYRYYGGVRTAEDSQQDRHRFLCHPRTKGQEDVITPTKAAIDYFDQVKSRHKKRLILIPNARAISAFMTAPNAFLAALTGKVRPVAVARGA